MGLKDYMKDVGSNLGVRGALGINGSGGNASGLDIDGLARWADDIEAKVKGGGGCGGHGGGGLDNGLLMNAAGEAILAGPALFTINVNVQGRPLSKNKLQMQTTVPGGAFKVTDIKVGTNALNFGGLVPSFVLDPTNQSTTGMDIEAPDHILSGATSVTISGESYTAGAHRIFAAFMSADREAYAEAAGKCRLPSR